MRCQVVYWQDIPSLVEVRKGRKVVHKEMLSERFQALIDTVAMKTGLEGTDAYLEQWRKDPVEVTSDKTEPAEMAQEIAQKFEDDFREIRDRAMKSASAGPSAD